MGKKMFRIALTVPMDADVTVEADNEQDALEKILNGVTTDSYNNNTAGYEIGACADASIKIEEVYSYYNYSVRYISEVER
jgi:hypothetical protein